jgi:hypothetical protein
VVGGISGASLIHSTIPPQSGMRPAADPYAYLTVPSYSGCLYNNYSTNKSATLNPGVYCGGMDLKSSNANVTLNPGIYILDQGSLSMVGNSTLTGAGVTIIFTSSTGSNYATASIGGGAIINLSAPTTGSTAGIALYGDRNMPVGTSYSFGGGSSQTIQGIAYFPKGAVSWAGNPTTTSSTCMELIADTITLVGDSGFATNCSAFGAKVLGPTSLLLE